MLFRLAIATILRDWRRSAAVDCAKAQTCPSRTITLVVPFPAGGPTDTIGRIVAEGLQSALGQPVIVENVPGATGSIGTGRVARSEADGHTLILGTIATHVFNGAAYELKYDVVKDFEPISLVAFDPQIIAVKKALPVADLPQLIAWLKENPDKAVAGTAGVGSTSHVSAVNFQALTGTQFRFIPYRGLGPAMAGPYGRPHRYSFRSGRELRAAGSPRYDQSSRRDIGQPPHFGSRSSYGRRSRPARVLLPQLACDLGATRYLRRRDRQTQCRRQKRYWPIGDP